MDAITSVNKSALQCNNTGGEQGLQRKADAHRSAERGDRSLSPNGNESPKKRANQYSAHTASNRTGGRWEGCRRVLTDCKSTPETRNVPILSSSNFITRYLCLDDISERFPLLASRFYLENQTGMTGVLVSVCQTALKKSQSTRINYVDIIITQKDPSNPG